MSLLLSGTDGLSDVDGTAATPAIRGTDTNTGIFFPAADTIAFSEGGAEIARFNSSANLGLGTTNPSFNVDVQTAGDAAINAQSTGTIQSARVRIVGRQTSVDEEWNIVAAGAGLGNPALRFVRGTWTNTPSALIDSSGNLLVGTTSTDPTFNRVSGTSLPAGGGINFRANNSSDIGRNVTSGGHFAFYTDNGSARVAAGNISSNGSTTSYNTSSDYRLKENVQPLVNALAQVAQIRPVTWQWKDGFGGTNTAGQGFIAHELQAVVPDCVTGAKDAVETVDDLDAEGRKIGTKEVPRYQGVDTSFLVATLVAALQESHQLIKDLQARVDALEIK